MTKTNFILKIILIIFSIIIFRLWLLSILQHEKRVKEALKPQRKTVVIPAQRGILFDRYGIPLAQNKINYRASVYYSHLKKIPAISWQKNKKTFPRRDYLKRLSNMLGEELKLDAEKIEDQIATKACFFPQSPFIIKDDLTEREYARLRLKERNWPGLHAEITTKRFYPHGKVACDIVGYLGAISQTEYLKIANEIQELKKFLNDPENPCLPEGFKNEEEVKKRLDGLREKSYTINDLIGKTGLEKTFERQLRGTYGRRTFVIDTNGNFLKKLEEKEEKTGTNIFSTISLELQKFTEELLLEDEKEREGKSKIYDVIEKTSIVQKQPWQKGGAIVAIDPNTGELLALASYPRFELNDFIPSSDPLISKKKQKKINRWLETKKHIANIWDGKEKMVREYLVNKKIKKEKQDLSFDFFLDSILPPKHPMRDILSALTVKEAIKLQEDVDTLLYFSNSNKTSLLLDVIFQEEITGETLKIKEYLLKNKEYLEKAKKNVIYTLQEIQNNRDKILLVDLCRLLVFSPAFSNSLIEKTKNITLPDFWKISRAILSLESKVLDDLKKIFHEEYFKEYRKKNHVTLLKEAKKIPLSDYLERVENHLFSEFWKKNKALFLTALLRGKILKTDPTMDSYFNFLMGLHQELKPSLLKNLDSTDVYQLIRSVRSFADLDRPLLNRYPRLRQEDGKQLEKHLAMSFYPINGFGYGRSKTYRFASPLGSIYKIVTAYSALKEHYEKGKKDLNPLTIIDKIRWDAKASKGGGMAVAYTLEGNPIGRHYKGGRLPKSHRPDIGRVDFISALEQSSNPYFSLLASEVIKSPQELILDSERLGLGKKTGIALPAEVKGNLPEDVNRDKTALYSLAIGQHSLLTTPLQAALMLATIANKGKVLNPKIVKDNENKVETAIFLPEEIRNMILKAMFQVINGEKGSARPQNIKKLKRNPELSKTYEEIRHQTAGKTSTAEFMYAPYVLPSSPAKKYKDIWFGVISFEDLKWEKPELVVVVYLRFSDAGKEAAPLAFQVIKKYREIKEKQ